MPSITLTKLTDTEQIHNNSRTHIFFSSVYGTLTKIYHNLGHKISGHKLKKIKIPQSVFSNHNKITLEITNNKVSNKPQY